MNCLSLAVFCAVVALASAGIHGIHGIHGDSAAVLSGPSGTVIRSGHLAPAVSVATHGAVIAAPAVVAGHGLLGHGILGHGVLGHSVLGHGLLGHGLAVIPPGSGLEGQWIPDINEHLYDDGSYKPHIYGH